LITGEKLIVREECSVVVERVLEYRARLLAAVANRMPSFDDLPKAVALTSLDVSGQSSGNAPLGARRDTVRSIQR